MALGQKNKVRHGALKYEREIDTRYKILLRSTLATPTELRLYAVSRHSGMLTVASQNLEGGHCVKMLARLTALR